jgi:glycosyltransferase involved in cell wall biosynthesis
LHLASLPLMRRVYRHADAVVTYGPHVSRYVERFRGNARGVFSAPQAVEPELFGRPVPGSERRSWREQAGLPAAGPLALYVGRLVEDKGVRVLLDAWRQVGVADRTLCLVGDGPLASDSALARPGVRLAGRLPRDRLPVAYAAADVVVVPSIATRRFLEPWGLVCNEAMSQGRPVVASDAVGAAAGGLVRDRQTGLVVPAGDAVALASALELALTDAELRTRLGEAARLAIADYTYEHAAGAFATALEYAREGAPV